MVIKIFAGPGEGKSTIAQWLTQEFVKFGFKVENGDEDPFLAIPLEKRLTAMGDSADPLSIEIKTIPFRAEGLPAYAKRHTNQ